MQLELTVGEVCLKVEVGQEFAPARQKFEHVGAFLGGKFLYTLELRDQSGDVILRRRVVRREKSLQG